MNDMLVGIFIIVASGVASSIIDAAATTKRPWLFWLIGVVTGIVSAIFIACGRGAFL